LFLLIPVFLFSCKKSVETNRYPLTQAELDFVPYQLGDTIGFIHSGGFEFDFQVVSLNTSWRKSETGHPGENYWSYEQMELIILSNEPELIFNFIVTPQSVMPWLQCKLNNNYFSIYSISQPTIDSLKINNTIYRDIFIFTNQIVDTNIITFDSLFYTKTNGLIKIGMNNEEAYYINN
jgi:hypothetical protein